MGSVSSGKINRAISYLIALGFVWSLFNRIFLTVTRRFDPDEFEHLHAAWMIHSGFLPYRDFWQNHTPLLYYWIAPLIGIFDEGIPLIFIVRSILSASALLILWMTYWLARLDHDRMTAVLSMLVLSCSYLFLHKTIEIRPDHFLVICWLSSLYLIFRYSRGGQSSLSIFIAGLLLGTGMLFTPKALLCLAAAFLLFVSRWVVVNRFKEFFQTVKFCVLYAFGFLIPVAAVAAFFYQKGVLRLFVESTFFTNLNFPEGRKLGYLLSIRYFVLFLFCAAGIGVCLRERNSNNGYRSRLLLAVPMIFLMVIFFVFLPTSNPQSALVFVPLMSIYAGIAFKKSIDWYSLLDSKKSLKPLLFVILAFLAGVAIPGIGALYEKSFTPGNKEQLERIDAVLKKTDQEDVFFDGNIAYVFRRQAYHYGSLIPAVRRKIEQGEIQNSIPQSLKDKQCKFVIYDDRVSLLPESIQRFIRNNYIPFEIPDVLIAGKQLSAEGFSGRKARFWIEIPLAYSITVNSGTDFKVDGKRYQGPYFLTTGTHLIISNLQLRSVLIRAANGTKAE